MIIKSVSMCEGLVTVVGHGNILLRSRAPTRSLSAQVKLSMSIWTVWYAVVQHKQAPRPRAAGRCGTNLTHCSPHSPLLLRQEKCIHLIPASVGPEVIAALRLAHVVCREQVDGRVWNFRGPHITNALPVAFTLFHL